MGKFWRIWKGSTKLTLAADLAYRFDFILKAMAYTLFNFFSPIITLLIYSNSSGIPGWSFPEFLLMSGTFLFAQGIAWTAVGGLPEKIIYKVQNGTYDADLIRPIRPLLLATAKAFVFDNIPNILVGAVIISYSLIKMGWTFNIWNSLGFASLILLAVLFFTTLDIIASALAFLATKTYTILNIFEEFTGAGKNPLTIYGVTGKILLTFVFPVGIAAFYPAEALLGRLSAIGFIEITIASLTFFGFSLLLWTLAIKKYTSAGG